MNKYESMGNLYSLDGQIPSSFFRASVQSIDEVNFGKTQFRGNKQWKEFFGLSELKEVVSITLREQIEFDTIQRNGIAFEFSKLKNHKEINDFANKYGLLGIKPPDIWMKMELSELKKRWGNGICLLLKTGFSYCEPLQLWEYYINQIRNILKLYRALVNIHRGDLGANELEDKYLRIGFFHNGGYMVEWGDGQITGCTISETTAEKANWIEIAREVLISSVINKSKTVNHFAANIIETGKPPLGFTIQESKYTNILLNTIYYDIWELISNNEPVHICGNPNCKLPFKKVKRQQYCSNACKQEAYRIRKSHSPN
ncbi:hypothetical protein BLX88_25895 [Bacillus obstructivus]|nr:hypothetical protein BLX88_25895 [Bacillus obstructivus]